MIDYLRHIDEETEGFNRAVAAIEESGGGGAALAATPAPTCGDWSAADLTWHLAEVQYFWASIVEGKLTGHDQVVRTERPQDDQLVAFHRSQGERLVAALEGEDPEAPCWSWHPAGNTVGWVLRRQAHEALIHRVDAELAAAGARAAGTQQTELSPIDETLATDGVDEMLDVMLNVAPTGNLTLTSDGATARLVTPARSWDLHLGQATGTRGDGEPIDTPAIQLAPLSGEPSVEIRTDASVLDQWLWRRCSLPEGSVTGDASVVDRLYELAKID